MLCTDLYLQGAELIPASQSPTLVLTANVRLARAMGRAADFERISAGHQVWETPDILPLGAWLERCWRDWLYTTRDENPPHLLRPFHELAVWEEIIGHFEDGAELLQVGATAQSAQDAWALLHAWRLPLQAAEWKDTSDSEAFRRWASEFQSRCELRHWLSAAQLADFVADKIAAGEIATPAEALFCGFAEFTPVEQRLLETLAAAKVQVTVRKGRNSHEGDAAVRVAFPASEDEFRSAAQWARKLVEAGARDGKREARIGVVVPEIARFRSTIERIFGETFDPNTRIDAEHDASRAFNISLGPALDEYPLIQTALLVLSSDANAIPIEDVSRILRSPFIGAAEEEHTRRGLLDRRLRDLREPEIPAFLVRSLASARGRPYSSRDLAARFGRWERSLRRSPSRQPPSDWAALFSKRLRAIGWPGNRMLSSAEYQTQTAWNELLSDFASLDAAAGHVSHQGALSMLERLATARQFQPQSEPAPVQILGTFEASGMEFDHLWIAGMHDGVWPSPPDPNPFLPLRLQRARNVPHSTPQRELDFALNLTRQLLGSSPDVIVSYPVREGDSELRPSPLFSSLPGFPASDPRLATQPGYAALLAQSSKMEILADNVAPAWDGVLVRGGTAIFRHQAACPFQAFARLRLGAEPLESAASGLSAADRGTLIHEVLRRVWHTIGAHDRLISMFPSELAAVVHESAQQAILEMAPRKQALQRPRFAAIESARVERLVAEWLKMETGRRPFAVLEQEEERQVTVGGVKLKLRADRIDRLEDGTHVVIDYKTSVHLPSEWEGARPDDPQLPLYAIAAGVPLSAVVFGIAKLGDIGFRGVSSDEGILPLPRQRSGDLPLAEREKGWRTVLEELAAAFWNGQAIVDPKKPPKTCHYCGLQSLCRVRESPPVEDEADMDAAIPVWEDFG